MGMARLITSAATVAIAGLALAGCTSAEPTPAADPAASEQSSNGAYAATVKQAAQTTKSANSAEMAGSVEIITGGSATELDLNGKVDFTSENFEGILSADLLGAGTEIKLRVVDETAYASVPFLGEGWIEAPAVTGVSTGVPVDLLGTLRKLGDVEEVGQETINDVTTTHYRGTLNSKTALKSLGLSAEDLEGTQGALRDLGKDAVIDVWIDDQDRIVKVSQEVSGTTDAGTTSGVASTFEFSNFGVPVDVKKPKDIIDPDLGGLIPQP